MTDAEYEEQKQRVQAVFDKWVKPLGLGWWRIEMNYERNDRSARHDDDADFVTTFTCHADWRYADALITAYLRTIQTITDEELEHAAVHELLHIFLNELRENKEDRYDHEERVATLLSRAFIWLRDSMTVEEHKEGQDAESNCDV